MSGVGAFATGVGACVVVFSVSNYLSHVRRSDNLERDLSEIARGGTKMHGLLFHPILSAPLSVVPSAG